MKKLFGFASIAALALPIAAHAASVSGVGPNGLNWTAESRIVGVTSTATAAGGGDPIYRAPASQSSGIVSIIINEPNGQFICSGTLLNDGRSIATAAHCVTQGSRAVSATSAKVYFNGNNTPDSITFQDPTSTAVDVKLFTVNNNYTGAVIDQNDIAILTLATDAPSWAARFGVYTSDLTGQDFTVSGYGRRSDTGGSVGANLGVGRLRQGDNRFDFMLGDADFAGGFSFLSENGAVIDYSYVSDFDNGLAANDTSCIIAQAIDPTLTSGKFCNLGRGPREVGVAGGDSGGPSFINGQLAAITSYGLTFGAQYGDVDNSLNSSFGEFSGYVPTFIHQAFIRNAMNLAVPESSTWSMMIAGFGLVGGAMRRRTKVRFAAA